MKLFVLFCVFALVSNSIAFGVSDFEEKIDNLFEEEEEIYCSDARDDQVQKTLVGKGSYGEVFSFTSHVKDECVVKVFKDDNSFEREVEALNKVIGCRNSHVISAKKVCPGDKSNKPMIVYPNFGSPLFPSQFEKEKVSPCFILSVMSQIVTGLRCMHYHGLAHNDIKPANILMKNGVVTIIDVGLAVKARQQTYCGSTYEFMDPTAARAICAKTTGTKFPYSKVDIYAFGMTMIYLLGNTLPFMTPAGLPAHKNMEIVLQHKDYSNLDNWMQMTDQDKIDQATEQAKGGYVDVFYYMGKKRGSDLIDRIKGFSVGLRKILLNMVSENIAIRPTAAVAQGFLTATRLYDGC